MLFSKKKEKEESYLDWKKREYKKSDKENRKAYGDTSDLKKRYDIYYKRYKDHANGRLIALGRTAAWEVAGCMSAYYFGTRLLIKGKKSLPEFPADAMQGDKSLLLRWIILLKVLRTAFDDEQIKEKADIFEKDAIDFIDCCISRYEVFLKVVNSTEEELRSIDDDAKKEGGLSVQERIWRDFVKQYSDIDKGEEWSELYFIMKWYNEFAYKEQKACFFAPMGLPEYPADVKILC